MEMRFDRQSFVQEFLEEIFSNLRFLRSASVKGDEEKDRLVDT